MDIIFYQLGFQMNNLKNLGWVKIAYFLQRATKPWASNDSFSDSPGIHLNSVPAKQITFETFLGSQTALSPAQLRDVSASNPASFEGQNFEKSKRTIFANLGTSFKSGCSPSMKDLLRGLKG